MRSTRTGTQARALRSPMATVVLAILTVAVLAVAALAFAPAGTALGAKPSRPSLLAPTGPVATPSPTFHWTRVAGAVRYEVRIYEGTRLLIRKSGISKTSWNSTAALPADVGLAWKVRAGGRAGTGPWSRSARFTIVTPS